MSLNDAQKNIIKWLVEKTHSEELTEEFNVAWYPSDVGGLNKRDYTGTVETIPTITKLALDAMEKEGLLQCDRKFRGDQETNRKCSLTCDAFTAVDSDFELKPTEPSSSMNFGNISNSQILVQQASPGATQTATFTLSRSTKEELTRFVDELESVMEQLSDLQIDTKDELGKLRLHVNTIRLHLESDYSDAIVVKESLKTVKSILEGILSSSIVAAALSPDVHRLAYYLLEQVSS